jgi:hypothetical protein
MWGPLATVCLKYLRNRVETVDTTAVSMATIYNGNSHKRQLIVNNFVTYGANATIFRQYMHRPTIEIRCKYEFDPIKTVGITTVSMATHLC